MTTPRIKDIRPFIPRNGARAHELIESTGYSERVISQRLNRMAERGEVVKYRVSHRNVRWYIAGQEPVAGAVGVEPPVSVKAKAGFSDEAEIVIPPGLKITQCPSAWKDKPLPEPDAAIPKREGAEDWRKCGRLTF